MHAGLVSQLEQKSFSILVRLEIWPDRSKAMFTRCSCLRCPESDMLLTLPMVLPSTVTGYYLITLFGRSGYIGKLFYQWTG
jgi:ABC-type molybdate transport system permease subunit